MQRQSHSVKQEVSDAWMHPILMMQAVRTKIPRAQQSKQSRGNIIDAIKKAFH